MADLLGEWISLYNIMFNDTVDPNEITEWDLNKVVKPEARSVIYKILQFPNLYRHVAPIAGAAQGVGILRGLGYRVVFVSSCVVGSADQKVEWLIRHGFIDDTTSPPRDVICAADKALIRGDILIDDAVHNVATFPAHTILVDRAYNRNYLHPHRARSWYDIVAKVTALVPLRRIK